MSLLRSNSDFEAFWLSHFKIMHLCAIHETVNRNAGQNFDIVAQLKDSLVEV
jgi:hypothetical protein